MATQTGTAQRGRSGDWKNLVIAVLATLLAVTTAMSFRGCREAPPLTASGDPAEEVRVFDVVIDREERAYAEILFDRQVGQATPGEVLGAAPATLDPPLAGNWRWLSGNALRFEPSGGFPVASQYELRLIADRLVGEEQVLAGDEKFTLRTDQLLVESVSLTEEPVLDARSQVVFQGQINFNYRVDPETLAPLLKLQDSLAEGGTVDVQIENPYWTRQNITFRTGPVQKTPEARSVSLEIAAALTPAEGNAPLGRDFVHAIPVGSSEKLTVRTVSSTPGPKESTLELQLSSPVAPAVARQYVSVEPKVDNVRFGSAANRLSLTGPFKPGATYTVKVGKGMPAQDDAVLQEAYSAQVRLSDLPASLDFESQGIFLSASGLRNLAIESVNVQQAQVAVDRVYLNNLFPLIQYGGRLDSGSTYSGNQVSHYLGDRLTNRTYNLKGARNETRTTVLNLGSLVGDEDQGLFRVQLASPGNWQAQQRWVLLTDLGAVAKRAAGEMLVWVASSRTLEPATGARVRLISDQNQVIGEGRADGRGLWRFSDKAALEKHRPFLVTVEQGNDFTFLFLDNMGVDTTGLDVGGAPPLTEGYTAFLYGERDIYRPGETVEGLAVVRKADLSPPAAMPATLIHRDPQGRVRSRSKVDVDGRGLASFDLGLLPASLTGRHTLALEIAEKTVGSYGFQVEEFVPDRIEVKIRPEGEAVKPGAELAYTVTSAYLFGPPASDLAVESRVRLERAPFAPEGYAGFAFGDPERELENREVFFEQGRLDEEGSLRLSTRLVVPGEVPESLEAVIMARVQEAGGRGVTALSRVPVHPYPYYLGIRRVGDGYPEPGEQVTFEFVAVGPDGKPAKAGALQAQLLLERWNTVLRKTPEGNFRYESSRESVPVTSTPVQGSDGASKGSFTITAADYGSHRLRITDPATGAAAAVQFYVSGWGYSPWAIENPARLDLELDKDEYAPGETASVLVRAPFPGTLVLTVERGEVYDVQVHRLEGNTAEIPVAIRGAFRPNAYVTGTLVRSSRDLAPGEVARAFGAVPLPVDRQANRLKVAIAAPEEVRSQSKLSVAVETRPGAVVTVAAVDEGVLQLIAQKTPDPFEFFYRKLALGVSSYDTFSLLFPEVATPQAAGGGLGADELSQYVRTDGLRRTKPVAFWSGPVTADGSGKGRVELDLPEFQGALRVMAVALDGKRFGSNDQRVRVRDPVVLLPTLPRSLSFGESIQVPVTVRNDTGKNGTFQVKLALDGPGKVAGDGPTRSVEVADGADATTYFTVETAAEPGEISFVLTAQGNGESTRSTGHVGVRSDLPPVTVGEAGALAEATLELPFTETGLRQGTESRRLYVGTVPLVQFAGRLRNLLTYPYGCLEQTVSRAFPLVYLGDLARKLEPELLDPDEGAGDPETLVQGAIQRIGLLQHPSGGFTLWPRGTEVDPWASIYATHFLVEANRAGYPMGSLIHDNALNYVSSQVRAKNSYGGDELERLVYGLYVLSRASRADTGTMDFLRNKHEAALRPESKSLLAAAYASVGDQQAVETLLGRIGEVDERARETGGNYGSAVRDRALLLLALVDANPAHPRVASLAGRLAREARTSGYWTTQETSFALLALGQLFRHQATRASASGEVQLGDEVLGIFTGSDGSVTFRDIEGRKPLTIAIDQGGAEKPYEAGSIFYSLQTRGIPTDEAFEPVSAGLEVERELLSRDKGSVDLGQVRQGDLVVLRTRVRSVSGPVENVVVESLLPSGLEVENPRLETTETLSWVTDATLQAAYYDLRDDRVLVFADLPANSWQTFYTVLRAVAPGSFRLPPVHAEAMYDPALRATGERGRLEVEVRR